MPLTQAKKTDKAKLQSQVQAALRRVLDQGASTIADKIEQRMDSAEEQWTGPAPTPVQSHIATHTGMPAAGVATDSRSVAAANRDKNVVGKVMLSIAVAGERGGMEGAAEYAGTQWGDDSAAYMALVSNVEDDGGAMVTEDYRQEWIDLLTPRVAVRALGPQIVPMPTGQLVTPKITAGTTAQYVGEATSPVVSQPKVGSTKMTSRELATIVPISNALIKRARAGAYSLQAETFVQRLAVRDNAVREDLAFLRGAGTEFSPKGLEGWALPANVITAATTQTLAVVLGDLAKTIAQLENQNVPMTQLGWIMSPRSKNALQFTILDGDSRPYFSEMIARGELLGAPFRATTQMPNNLAVTPNSDTSRVVLADFDQIMIGDEMTLEVATSTEAAYLEGATWKSAFGNNVTLLRLVSRHDLAPEHEEAIVVLEGTRWGI